MTEIVIVGLGYGAPGSITRDVWDILNNEHQVFVKTTKHPTVDYLAEAGIPFKSFDHCYNEEQSYHDVYSRICNELIVQAADKSIVYAIPGDPGIGEDGLGYLKEQAENAGITLRLYQGVSFIEPVLEALGVGLNPGMQIRSAIGLQAPLDKSLPLLLYQVSDRPTASKLKQLLLDYYPNDYSLTIISSAGLANQHIEKVELCALERSGWFDRLTCIYIPAYPGLVQSKDIETLLKILEHLRSSQGCPWDKEQTHSSLAPFTLEESYEVVDAIAGGDGYKICEELGDLLLQIVFHSQIAAEHGHFDFKDVVLSITGKLIRRHPHIFAEREAQTPEEVSVLWEEVKKQEQTIPQPKIPPLPGLLQLQKLMREGKIPTDFGESDPLLNQVIAAVRQASEQNRCLDAEIKRTCAKFWS